MLLCARASVCVHNTRARTHPRPVLVEITLVGGVQCRPTSGPSRYFVSAERAPMRTLSDAASGRVVTCYLLFDNVTNAGFRSTGPRGDETLWIYDRTKNETKKQKNIEIVFYSNFSWITYCNTNIFRVYDFRKIWATVIWIIFLNIFGF